MPKAAPYEDRVERFFGRVKEDANGCWIWQGPINEWGYGRCKVGPRAAGVVFAHRFAYEAVHGPIPEGLQIDHLCRITACVNPDHLEPVTRAENIRRAMPFRKDQKGRRGSFISVQAQRNAAKTHCYKGHPFDEVNTYRSKGKRFCRACRRASQRAYKQRLRQRRAVV